MSLGPPGGTVTFLFTVVEDATRLWEDEPAAMATALQVHDGIVRAAVDAHDGFVFSTDRDGFGAAFATASDAVDAAIDAQQHLIDAALPLAVRM
ncbi:MAG TPA: hypothetical protein VMK16_05510, partial [Acidimicrobiales bacterium]|nr:hypothetical protein [Acidimicrobiales bacterium]